MRRCCRPGPLGWCFLDGAAGQALATEAAAGGAVRLAAEVQDARLAALPWEALVLPGQVTPLVLQDGCRYTAPRCWSIPPPAIRVRGRPARIRYRGRLRFAPRKVLW
jgi:hypothetical protein